MSFDLIYGAIPTGLGEAPKGAVQCSPLWPGSVALEALAPHSADSLTMLAPPGAIERRHDLALALRALKPDAPLTVLAPKDKGGSRLAKELAGFGVSVMDTPKRHHRICTGLRPANLANIDEAINGGTARQVPTTGLWSQPGIFSWDRLDTGTAILLDHLPILSGRGADFGCGNGVLARAVLQQDAVKSLIGLDIDRRATTLAARNVPDPRFETRWRDVRRDGAGAQDLDFVVMNPPFHNAGQEDRALGLDFITRASEALKAGGLLLMVANRHLPYEAALQSKFKAVKIIYEGQGFKVHEATK